MVQTLTIFFPSLLSVISIFYLHWQHYLPGELVSQPSQVDYYQTHESAN